MKPIDVYFWPTPNGKKVTVCLEEMELSYRVIPINIDAGEQFQESFLAISPNNKMPAIVDYDSSSGEPISIFESGAILRYLGEKFGKLYPKTIEEKAKVDEWLFWQVGGLGPMLGQAFHFNKASEKIPYAIARYQKEAERLYGVIDRQLAKHPYLAGDYLSIADIASYPWVIAYARYVHMAENFPHVHRWSSELGNRPAFIKGMHVKI